MQEAESFHFELKANISANMEGFAMEVPISFIGDYVAPDRTRGKISFSLGFISLDMEAITIGDTAYITNPETGEWEITEGSVTTVPNPADFTGLTDGIAFEGIEIIGEDILDDGTPVLKLSIKTPEDLFGGEDNEVKTEIWIGRDDSLIREVRVEGSVPLDENAADLMPGGSPFGSGGLTGGTADISMSFVFSQYNSPIEIEAPIP